MDCFLLKIVGHCHRKNEFKSVPTHRNKLNRELFSQLCTVVTQIQSIYVTLYLVSNRASDRTLKS